jgi:hypothetical protein
MTDWRVLRLDIAERPGDLDGIHDVEIPHLDGERVARADGGKRAVGARRGEVEPLDQRQGSAARK